MMWQVLKKFPLLALQDKNANKFHCFVKAEIGEKVTPIKVGVVVSQERRLLFLFYLEGMYTWTSVLMAR